MGLRRCSIVFCTLVAALAPEGAAARSLAHVEVCGRSTCIIVADDHVLARVAAIASGPVRESASPPPMQPFYSLRIRTSAGTPDTAYYVARPGILRLTVGRRGVRQWVALDARTRAAFNRVLRDIAPALAPTPLLVTVGARPAADATAYRALYGPLPRAPAPPREPPPTKIVLTTMTPSPWSGGATIRLLYAAAHRTLLRDGEWVRVTPRLARALERDGQIEDGNAWPRPLLLVAGAVAAAVAAAAAATRRLTA